MNSTEPMEQSDELKIRKERGRFVLVLGSDEAAGRHLLEGFLSGNRHFPDGVLVLPSATWVGADIVDQVMAKVGVHLVSMAPGAEEATHLKTALDDRLLLRCPQVALGRKETIQFEASLIVFVEIAHRRAPIVVVAGTGEGADEAWFGVYHETVADEDSAAPFIHVDAIHATTFFERFPELWQGSATIRVGQISVPLSEVWTDPAERIGGTFRIVSERALVGPDSEEERAQAYAAMWHLDETRYAASFETDLAEWWAVHPTRGLAYEREVLPHHRDRLLKRLDTPSSRATGGELERYELPVDPASGATLALRQLAFAAAAAGHPTLVLRAFARSFDASQIQNFLLNVRRAAEARPGGAARRALLVVDTQHTTEGLQRALGELGARFNADIVLLVAVPCHGQKQSHLSSELAPSEKRGIARWVNRLREQGMTHRALSSITNLEIWVAALEKRAGRYGFFHVLNAALHPPPDASDDWSQGVVSTTLKQRVQQLCTRLSSEELSERRSAAEELAMVAELAKVASAVREHQDGRLPLPIRALREVAAEAAGMVNPSASKESSGAAAESRPSVHDLKTFAQAFRSRTIVAQAGSSDLATYRKISDDQFSRRWFVQLGSHGTHADQDTMDAEMVCFAEDVLTALNGALLPTSGPDQNLLRALLDMDGPREGVAPAHALRRVLRLLTAGRAGAELTFCERASELYLRGSSRFGDWETGSQEYRLEIYSSLHTSLRDHSRVLLHHYAMVLRRSSWWAELSVAQRIDRLDQARAMLEAANRLPWVAGQRDDAPTHVKTTLGIVLRELAELTGKRELRTRAVEQLREALAHSAGRASPHTALALSEILLEGRDTRRDSETTREFWLKQDVADAIDLISLLSVRESPGADHRWQEVREAFLQFLDSVLQRVPSDEADPMVGWLRHERKFFAVVWGQNTADINTRMAAQENLLRDLESLLKENSDTSRGQMVRRRCYGLLVDLQEVDWQYEREPRIVACLDGVYGKRLDTTPSDQLFRRAIAHFQTGQFTQGEECYKVLRSRDSTRSLPGARVWLRGRNGDPVTLDVRIEREDGEQLFGKVLIAGDPVFSARGRSQHFEDRRRGSMVRGSKVALFPNGPRFFPATFANRAR